MIIDHLLKDKIQHWLLIRFNYYQFISEVYLIGSILNKLEINDVDVVQLINLNSKESLEKYAKELKKIQSNFFDTFNIRLHLTSFIYAEKIDFINFMSINNSIKII